jgi:multisubunit Na+/H+ antiporter MnhB subunit
MTAAAVLLLMMIMTAVFLQQKRNNTIHPVLTRLLITGYGGNSFGNDSRVAHHASHYREDMLESTMIAVGIHVDFSALDIVGEVASMLTLVHSAMSAKMFLVPSPARGIATKRRAWFDVR